MKRNQYVLLLTLMIAVSVIAVALIVLDIGAKRPQLALAPTAAISNTAISSTEMPSSMTPTHESAASGPSPLAPLPGSGSGISSTQRLPLPHIPLELAPYWPNDLDVAEVNRTDFVLIDNNNIPIYNYGTMYDNARMQYNPTLVAQYALALYERAQLDSSEITRQADLHLLLEQAEWLVVNAEHAEDSTTGKSFLVWHFYFPNLPFGAKSTWVSGMTQGMALAALVEAHSLTGDPRYLETAQGALQAFAVKWQNGGVRTDLEDGGAWYEEVATPDGRSTQILNGFLFALQGIQYYLDYTGDPQAKQLLDDGLKALANRLPTYDVGWMSNYDAEQRLAYFDYNTIHAKQLLYFYHRTGWPVLRLYAERFAMYSRETDYAVTATQVISGYGPDLLSTWTANRNYYYSSGLLPVTVTLDFQGCLATYGAWMQGRSDQSLPTDYEIQATEDGVTWKPVPLDASRSKSEKLAYDEPIIVSTFEKPILAQAIRYVFKTSAIGTPPGAVALERIRVLTAPSAPEMQMMQASSFSPAAIKSCLASAPPKYPVTLGLATVGPWRLKGFTPLFDTEFWDGHPTDVLFFWQNTDTHETFPQLVQGVQNEVKNGGLVRGVTGAGLPVGFPLDLADFPGQLIQVGQNTIGRDVVRAIGLTRKEGYPGTKIETMPFELEKGALYLLGAQVLPGNWGKVEYVWSDSPEKLGNPMTPLSAGDATWNWAMVQPAAYVSATLRLRPEAGILGTIWFNRLLAIKVPLPVK